MHHRVTAILLAGGSGKRFAATGPPKQLVELHGRPLFLHAVSTYAGMPEVDRLVLAAHRDYTAAFAASLAEQGLTNRVTIVEGGLTRQASIQNALAALPDTADDIGVLQNTASPRTTAALVRRCLAACERAAAVQAYVPAHHTVFVRDADTLDRVLPREQIGYTCDPTLYRMSLLRRVIDERTNAGLPGEMTLTAVRALGEAVALVESEPDNIKLTVPSDLATLRQEPACGACGESPRTS